MNWQGLIALLMLAVPFAEWSALRTAGGKKELAAFAGLWCLAMAAVVAEWLGLPMPRPLDWIRVVAQPINKLLS